MDWDLLYQQLNLDTTKPISVQKNNLEKRAAGERRKYTSFAHRRRHWIWVTRRISTLIWVTRRISTLISRKTSTLVFRRPLITELMLILLTNATLECQQDNVTMKQTIFLFTRTLDYRQLIDNNKVQMV